MNNCFKKLICVFWRIILNSQDIETSYVFTERQMSKEYMVCVYYIVYYILYTICVCVYIVQCIYSVPGVVCMECYSATKKWNLAFYNKTDETGEYFVKWNKSDGERQIPYDFIQTWNIKLNQTKQNKNKLKIHRHLKRDSSGLGVGEMSKEKMYGGGWKLDFGWWMWCDPGYTNVEE